MKKRITLDLPIEVVEYIKKTAKSKNITASQFVEETFSKFLVEEKNQTNLKKVS
jgi:hypothetical protein